MHKTTEQQNKKTRSMIARIKDPQNLIYYHHKNSVKIGLRVKIHLISLNIANV